MKSCRHYRRRRPEVLREKGFLKSSALFAGKHLCLDLFLLKLQSKATPPDDCFCNGEMGRMFESDTQVFIKISSLLNLEVVQEYGRLTGD